MPTYAFLNEDGDIQEYERADDPDSKIAQAEVIIMVDANEWERTDTLMPWTFLGFK